MRGGPEGGIVPVTRDDKQDIALAGFLMTADEWSELDPQTRAELVAVVPKLLPCPETASLGRSRVLPPEA